MLIRTHEQATIQSKQTLLTPRQATVIKRGKGERTGSKQKHTAHCNQRQMMIRMHYACATKNKDVQQLNSRNNAHAHGHNAMQVRQMQCILEMQTSTSAENQFGSRSNRTVAASARARGEFPASRPCYLDPYTSTGR